MGRLQEREAFECHVFLRPIKPLALLPSLLSDGSEIPLLEIGWRTLVSGPPSIPESIRSPDGKIINQLTIKYRL